MASDKVIPISPKIRMVSVNLQDLKTYINSLRPDQVNGFVVAVETTEGISDLRSFNQSYGLLGSAQAYVNLLLQELIEDDSEADFEFHPENPDDLGPVA